MADLYDAFEALLPPQVQNPNLLPNSEHVWHGVDIFRLACSEQPAPNVLIHDFFLGLIEWQENSDPFYFAFHLVSRIGLAIETLASAGLPIVRQNITGIMIGVLTVLYKSVDDHHLANSHIASILQGLVTLEQLNQIELQTFLLLMKAPNTRLLFTL